MFFQIRHITIIFRNGNNKNNKNPTHKTYWLPRENQKYLQLNIYIAISQSKKISSDYGYKLIIFIYDFFLTIHGKIVKPLLFIFQIITISITSIIQERTHHLQIMLSIVHAKTPNLKLQVLVLRHPMLLLILIPQHNMTK